MNPKKKLILNAVIVLLGCVHFSVLTACPDLPTPPDNNAGAGAEGSGPGPSSQVVPSTNAEARNDPVLLNTGEFLFKRTDLVNSDRGLPYLFPIVRTYRSKPAPVTMLSAGMGGHGPGRLAGGGEILYSDPCVFRWKEPQPNPCPYKNQYEFNVNFTISPATGFKEEPIEEFMYYFLEIPSDGEWPWTGKAISFELGTGITYSVSIVYTRRDPTWQWNGFDWLAIYPYSTHEIYRWETEFTIPEFEIEEVVNIPTQQSCPMSMGAGNQIPAPQWTPGWDMSYNMRLIEYPGDGVNPPQIHFYSGDRNIHIYQPSSVPDSLL